MFLYRFCVNVFNSAIVRKVLVIFTVGLVSRCIVNHVYDINVFKDYTDSISLNTFKQGSCIVVKVRETTRGLHELSKEGAVTQFNAQVDYKFNKKRKVHIVILTVNIKEFRFKEDFLSKIHDSDILPLGSYSVFIKIRHDKDLYKMAGFQFGLTYLNKESLDKLYAEVESRLKILFDKYKLEDRRIDYVAVHFVPVSTTLLEHFKLPPMDKSMDSALDPKGFITSEREHEARVDTVEEFKLVPVSTALDNILPKIKTTVENGVITDIPVVFKNKTINLLEGITHQNKFATLRKTKRLLISEFKQGWTFYQVGSGRYEHVLGIYKVSDTEVMKVRYSLSGSILDSIVDKLQEDNTVIRERDNFKYVIDSDHNILRVEYDMNLIPIKKKVKKNFSYIENHFIGAVDTETIRCKDGINRVYCLGFKSNLDTNPVIFYVKDDKESGYSKYDDVVLELVETLLTKKYNKVTFYCHNMAKFDIYFLLGVLLRHNRNVPDDSQEYKLSYVLRDKDIIKLTVGKRVDGVLYKFSIQDSYVMLTQSQAKLCEVFKVDSLKTSFPYKFLNEDHLSYVGCTPDAIFYNDMDDQSPEYKSLKKEDGCFKDESIKYFVFESVLKGN